MFTTFVINLDKDTDRMQFMHEQLIRLGIQYQRHNAVLGKDYLTNLEEYDEKRAVAEGGHALLPGEIGCALSHAQVLEKIVNEKIPFTLVLEDDVSLPKNFKQVLENEIAANQKDWEYLLFDYVVVGLPFLKQWFFGVLLNIQKKWKENKAKAIFWTLGAVVKGVYIVPLSLFEGFRNSYKKTSPGPVTFFRPLYFAGAYLVSLEGAQKLFSLTKPVVYTADQLPNKARVLKSLKFRGYAPQVVFQQKKKFGSSILNLSGNQIT